MGRQTLMAPVEWMKDGWYRIPSDFDLTKPVKKPAGTAPKGRFGLSDDFAGTSLKPHWKFYGEYKEDRFELGGNGILIKGKGNSVANSCNVEDCRCAPYQEFSSTA